MLISNSVLIPRTTQIKVRIIHTPDILWDFFERQVNLLLVTDEIVSQVVNLGGDLVDRVFHLHL